MLDYVWTKYRREEDQSSQKEYQELRQADYEKQLQKQQNKIVHRQIKSANSEVGGQAKF